MYLCIAIIAPCNIDICAKISFIFVARSLSCSAMDFSTKIFWLWFQHSLTSQTGWHTTRVRRFHLKNSFSKQNETRRGPFCFLFECSSKKERTWQDSKVKLLQGLSLDDLSQVLLVLLHVFLVYTDVGAGSWILYSRHNYGINTI